MYNIINIYKIYFNLEYVLTKFKKQDDGGMGTLVRDFCYMPGNRDALKLRKGFKYSEEPSEFVASPQNPLDKAALKCSL